MTKDALTGLFEHNNWANRQIIQTCSALSDEQLDAEPHSATMGSIRETLLHLVRSQQGYLSVLTVAPDQRKETDVSFDTLDQSANNSGEGLLALVRGDSQPLEPPLRTRNDYRVEPWVVLVQVINHATEHREQIKSMLSALGVTPPDIDGWTYGASSNALTPE
jgi:uncharacterized damage-inducible protein DinB